VWFGRTFSLHALAEDAARADEREAGQAGSQYIQAPYAQQPAAIFRSEAEALARIAGAHWSVARTKVRH
jgi:hypothetical protein